MSSKIIIKNSVNSELNIESKIDSQIFFSLYWKKLF